MDATWLPAGDAASSALRIVTWNILAQVYTRSSWFPHSKPSSCLKWKNRRVAVVEALRSLGADVYCLQEVDEFGTFYKEEFEASGYGVVYKQRTGMKKDGSLVAFRKERLSLVKYHEVEYNDLIAEAGGVLSAEAEERLRRDCVGVLAVLTDLKVEGSPPVVVASTHIFWDPELRDVKLKQAQYLQQQIQAFAPPRAAVVVGGDFNSVPGSEVFQFMTGSAAEGIDGGGLPPVPPVKLSSIWGAADQHPVMTTATPGFTATIDYLFVSPDLLRVTKKMVLPSIGAPELEPEGLPNAVCPSDHWPVGCEVVAVPGA